MRQRLAAAQRLLEDPGQRLETVAAEVGFGGAERLRAAFRRVVGSTPQQWQDRQGRRRRDG
jgi:AraC-like DNA-binding protein